MMYFSRVRIESGVQANMNLIKVLNNDIYAIHQLIWKLFPDQPDSGREFLYRQEFEKEQMPFVDSRRGMPIFYVLSKKKPVPVNGLLRVETKEYNPKLKSGMKLVFNIRVNPIVARKIEGKENSSKHDVQMDAKFRAQKEGITDRKEIKRRMEEAVIEWMVKKGEASGFQIAVNEGENRKIEVSAHRQNLLRKKGGNEIRFNSVELSGILIVKDPERFKQVLFEGIGHSRSFGSGMLMVRKI